MVKSLRSLKVGAMGTGLRMPPSMMSSPSMTTGLKKIGRAMDALTASKTGPWVNQTSLRREMFAATAVKLMERSSMRASPTRSRRVSMSRSPFISPSRPNETSSRASMSRLVMARAQRS